jgi:hypothetical protein
MKLRRVSLPRVAKLILVLTTATTACAVVTGVGDAWSIALGGAFTLANFHLIRMLVSLLIRPELGRRAGPRALVLVTLKLLLVVALVAGVVYQLPVAPLSFAIGASTLLVACVLEAGVLGDPVTSGADNAPQMLKG